MNEFIQKVKQMRDAQALYFQTRKKGALIQAKELEKEVDNMITKFESKTNTSACKCGSGKMGHHEIGCIECC